MGEDGICPSTWSDPELGLKKNGPGRTMTLRYPEKASKLDTIFITLGVKTKTKNEVFLSSC